MAVSGEISSLPEITRLGMDLPTSGSDKLNIVITGKVGTGKSTLINGLIGRQVAKEQTGAHAVITKIESFAEVFEIEEKSGSTKVITVNVWKTPRFSDLNMDDEQLEKLRTELARYFNMADLILYCVDMRDRHLQRSDIIELKQLTESTSEHIWNNAMIVLTFANKVVPENPDVDRKKIFQSALETWKVIIQTQFQRRLKLSEKTIDNIAIVPTGYRSKSPPDRVDWFSQFWGVACCTVKKDARSNLVSIKVTTADNGPYQMKINLKEILDNTTKHQNLIAFTKSLGAIGRVLLKRDMSPLWSGVEYLETQALKRISEQRVSSETENTPLLDGETIQSQTDPLLDGENSESQTDT